MNVRLGWSGDIHGTWTKMDVEVDENDLALHFIEAGLEGTPQLTPVEKFKLLYSLAETFVQLHKMSRFPQFFGTEEDKEELSKLISTKNKLTFDIMKRNLSV